MSSRTRDDQEAVRRSLNAEAVWLSWSTRREHLAPAAPLHKMSFDELRTEIETDGFDSIGSLDFCDAARADLPVR